MRNSRWDTEPRLDKDGKIIPVIFGPPDLEICRLLAPIRNPWGYQYLPTSYFHPLLNRGSSLFQRLNELTDQPGCYIKRPVQPRTNNRQLIYALDNAGANELRMAGSDLPRSRLQLRDLSHELMACLIAASFEYGAIKHNIPIIPKIWPDKHTVPDCVPFIMGDTLVIIEADTGSETIESEGAATSISGKYKNYLAIIKDGSIAAHFNVTKIAIVFVTTRESRRISMIEVLKRVIDKMDDDHDLAEHFLFTHMEYDRYINKIPKLTDWAVTQPYQRAGFEPFQFVR